jgi:CBS domain-containing protein
LFERHDFNCLPVVESGKLVGVLTKLDFLKAFGFPVDHPMPHYREAMAREVATVMTTEPTTFEPEAPLTRVLQKMITTRYKAFPVVDDGRLVGMISRGDVVRALREATSTEDARTSA